MSGAVFFPKHLDKNRLFGPLEIDEAAFVILGVGFALPVGFMLGMNVAIVLIGGLFAGVFMALTVKRIKSKYAEGYIYHKLYISGLKHPHDDSPQNRVAYPHLYKKGLRLLPQGYFGTLVG